MRLIVLFFFFSAFVTAQNAVQKAEQYITQKQYKKAQDTLISFLKNNTTNTQAIELLGDAYGHQKQWNNAIAQYQKLIKLQPKNANYHYKYGGVLGMKALSVSKFKALGIIGDVKQAFLKAVTLNPKHIDAHWALVDLYVSLPAIVGGSNAKAMVYAKKLKALSTLDGYLAMAYVYEYDKKPAQAKTYYLKALEKYKTLSCNSTTIKRNAIRYQIGKIAADYNLQLDKGESCLNTYLKNHSAKDGVPKAWAYYRLAQIYKHKANKNKALAYLDKALKLKPNFKEAKKEKALLK